MKKAMIIIISVLVIFGFLVYANPGQIFTKAYIRLTGDYASPEYESPVSILAKVKRDSLIYDRLYRVKDLNSYKDFQRKKILGVPFVQIYNKDKHMLSTASGKECEWALMNFFKQQGSLVVTDSLMYNFVQDRLEPIDLINNQDTFDFYIQAGWANYIPKLSTRLFEQTNEIKETLNDKVCISYINLDFQEEWEAELEAPEK